MAEFPNIRALIDAGREEEAIAVLMEGVHLRAATGARSAQAALEVAKLFYGGDVKATAWFMTRPRGWLGGQTPIERAEESEEGLELVIDRIRAIDAGVYI